MLLVNEPVPEPLLVDDPGCTVGLVEVLQHTPLAVTGAPPVAVTLPPEVAEVWVMADAAVVVTVGMAAGVVKVISLP
jgi:hypothetical protein